MTPTTFLHLLTATQAERDAAPCVAPVAGHLTLDRSGNVFTMADPHHVLQWLSTGADIDGCAEFDIIATLDLQATLERVEELEDDLESVFQKMAGPSM